MNLDAVVLLQVISSHISEIVIIYTYLRPDIFHMLPAELRQLWPAYVRRLKRTWLGGYEAKAHV